MSDIRVPIANPVVVLREEADEWAILFNPDTNGALALNPVAVEIWRRVDGKRSSREIASALAADFDEVPDSQQAEVGEFIERLARMGFVGFEEESPS